MLRKKRWPILLDESFEPDEMLPIWRRAAANGKTHAVDRNRIVRPDTLEKVMRRATRPHVVLRMDFEEIGAARESENVVGVLGLEPCADSQGRNFGIGIL